MLGAFSDEVAKVPDWVAADGGDDAYRRALASILGLAVSKLAMTNSTQADGTSAANPDLPAWCESCLWPSARVQWPLMV